MMHAAFGSATSGTAEASSYTLAAAPAPADDTYRARTFNRPVLRDEAARVGDEAYRSVIAARNATLCAALCAIAVLAPLGWWLADPAAQAWSVAALLVGTVVCALAWRLRRLRRDGVSARIPPAMRAAGAMLFTLFALAPWCLSGRADASVVAAIAAAGLALFFACALAPLKTAAFAAVVWPASSALQMGISPALPDGVASAGCMLAGALALLLVESQHRRWLQVARRAVAQEDRIRDLTAERDAALHADLEKSRFLAIASHDLRQPVHAIGLFAATLEKRLQGTADEPVVRNLRRAIEGLDQSFNVMLDISRLDAGAIEPRVQHFPLRDLFRRLHMHFAGQAEQKGLGLRFSPGGKSISSDPQLLERLLGNLVQNAIKYTERGGIVVVARSTARHLNIEVWDTGIGIGASNLPRVFDEFYQVGRSARVRTQGLGMGLAIVKRLTRLLGHDLTVASRPGRGTMFRLRIALGALPEIQDVTAAADTLPMPALSPRTVLVLDDEEAIREGLCLLLNEWGYDTIVSGSIEEAESALASLDMLPDLMLSDLHLGDGPDGIAAIERIRRQCGCDIAAILITGDTSVDEIRRITESGHPVLFKPVQPRKLYDALRGMAA